MEFIALKQKPAEINAVGPHCLVTNFSQITEEDVRLLLHQLYQNDFYLKEETQIENWHYYALGNGTDAFFVNYFPALEELNVVEEKQSQYFSYSDYSGDHICPPQISQVHVDDCGMSYAIRLSDGRFIVIDGGWDKEYDAKSLFSVLKEGSPAEKPVIAAWIQTHPHTDHYRCFLRFMALYADQVAIEKMLFHFPACDEVEHYPALNQFNPNKPTADDTETACITRMLNLIEEHKLPAYTPHTGQTYQIGDAKIHFLACIDDTVHRSQNINATSLVFRMELGEQVILWTGDCAFSEIRLPNKCPAYLKSDILQVPHHGFQCGTSDAEIEAYSCIRPKTCFIPVEEALAYSEFCTFVAGTRYVMTDAGVDEIFVCDQTHTITLPYTPNLTAYPEYLRTFRRGRESVGAYTWIFTDLNTGNPADLEFTAANFTKRKATISVILLFEDKKYRSTRITFEVDRDILRRICLTDPTTLRTIANKEIPANVPFAVRFNSDYPIVISNQNRTATYRSQNID